MNGTGIGEVRTKLLDTDHKQWNCGITDAFKNCGSNTESGRAELAQIPTSWGGELE